MLLSIFYRKFSLTVSFRDAYSDLNKPHGRRPSLAPTSSISSQKVNFLYGKYSKR